MAVTFLIDDHPREHRPYVLRDVADCLRVPRDEIEDVLANWSPDKLIEHLSTFTRQELLPPALRR
jgi:hypothetical protein